MYLVFDTETTGLPARRNAPISDVGNYPRVISIAYQVYDKSRQLIEQYDQLIKPDRWTIPLDEFWQLNGYFTEINERKGVPISDALLSLRRAAAGCDYMIAHNIEFDFNTTACEFYRARIPFEQVPIKICTCEYGKKFCEIPNGNGYRPPRLGLLYKAITGKNFTGAHDALKDCAACAECFFMLLDKGYIPPKQTALF